MNENAVSVTPRRRWRDRLFPTRSLLPIETPTPGMVDSEMLTEVMVVLDWRECLRLCASGRLQIVLRQETDVLVQACRTRAMVYVLPPGTPVPTGIRVVKESSR